MKVTDLSNEQRDFLLNQPHQLYVVDDLLNSRIEAFTSHITFSNTTPAGNPGIAITVTMATNDLYRFAKEIIDSIEAQKDTFAQQYSDFTSK